MSKYGYKKIWLPIHFIGASFYSINNAYVVINVLVFFIALIGQIGPKWARV
jgi:hypothetical protein